MITPAIPRPLTDEERGWRWSIDHQVWGVLRAEDRRKARYHLRELRKRIGELERTVLARFDQGGGGGEG